MRMLQTHGDDFNPEQMNNLLSPRDIAQYRDQLNVRRSATVGGGDSAGSMVTTPDAICYTATSVKNSDDKFLQLSHQFLLHSQGQPSTQKNDHDDMTTTQEADLMLLLYNPKADENNSKNADLQTDVDQLRKTP